MIDFGLKNATGGALAAVLFATMALPGSASAQTNTHNVVPENKTYDIPGGDLGPALTKWAQKAKVRLLVSSSVTRGVKTSGAHGPLTAEGALQSLLNNTKLVYRFTDARTVIVLSHSAIDSLAQGVSLDTIEVASQADNGVVATRSTGGTKTDTPLIETPQSISIVNREQIEDQGVQSVRQALRYTPGVIAEYRGAGGSRYDTILYRGFGGGVNYDYSYLDGMRLLGANYNVPQIDPYLLERVEIVKGPASVLFGQNNPGGLVNLVSKMPTAIPYREVMIQGGTFGRIRGGFDLSGPIDRDGKFLYRITGEGHTADTQVNYQREQRVAIAPALTWRPDADTTLTVLAKYQRDPYGGYFGFLPAVGTVLPLPNGQRIPRNFFDGSPQYDKFDRTEAAIGYKFDHRMNDVWSISSNFRYMHTDLDYKSVYTTGINVAAPNNPLLNRSAIFNLSRADAITTDNHALAQFDTGALQHRLLFGLDYQWLGYAETQGTRAQTALSIFNPNYSTPIVAPATSIDANQTLNQMGLYAQDQIKIGRLNLLFGLRQDWARNRRTDRLAPPTVTQNDSALTWRTGAIYNFDNGIAPYVSYSTSFQPSSGADVAGNLFKPTTGKQTEIGIKYQPPGYNALLTAAYYDLRQQNVLVSDPANPLFSIQTGEVRSRGIELEARTSLAFGLDLIASYSYMDNINAQSTTAQDKRPTYVPDQTAAFWADYTFQHGELAGFGVAAGIRYAGRSYADAANTISVSPYTVVDAAVHFDFGRRFADLKGWRAAVNVSNIADKTYVSACATATKCFWGMGRTIIGTLSYRW